MLKVARVTLELALNCELVDRATALDEEDGIGESRMAPTRAALPAMKVAGSLLKKHTPEPRPSLPPWYVYAMHPGRLSQKAKHSLNESTTCDEAYALHSIR